MEGIKKCPLTAHKGADFRVHFLKIPRVSKSGVYWLVSPGPAGRPRESPFDHIVEMTDLINSNLRLQSGHAYTLMILSKQVNRGAVPAPRFTCLYISFCNRRLLLIKSVFSTMWSKGLCRGRPAGRPRANRPANTRFGDARKF